jgi:hypothetical protein
MVGCLCFAAWLKRVVDCFRDGVLLGVKATAQVLVESFSDGYLTASSHGGLLCSKRVLLIIVLTSTLWALVKRDVWAKVLAGEDLARTEKLGLTTLKRLDPVSEPASDSRNSK